MTIKYPENEYVKLTYCDYDSTPLYLITRERHGIGKYYLYKIKKNGSLTKLNESDSPQFKEVTSTQKRGD